MLSTSTQQACLWISTRDIEDQQIVSRCMMKVQLFWEYVPDCPGKVVRVDAHSRKVLSGPVDIAAMTTAFIQDLLNTRESAQYHRALGYLRKDICTNASLRFDQKIEKLIQLNHGFGLPIALAVLNEKDNGIDEIVLSYGGQVLTGELQDYIFFKDLHKVAEKPYVLEPIGCELEKADVGKGGNSQDEISIVGDSEDEDLLIGEIESAPSFINISGGSGLAVDFKFPAKPTSMLSQREVMGLIHGRLNMHVTQKLGLYRLTKEDLALKLWARVGPLVGLYGTPPASSTIQPGRGEFFSVFHMPAIQTASALATYVAAREAVSSPVVIQLMSITEVEFLIRWRDMAYARLAVQQQVECGSLDPLFHHQGLSVAKISKLYSLDTAIIVDLHHTGALVGWGVPSLPRFILLENFMGLKDWVMAPPDGMPKGIAWVEWMPRPYHTEDDEAADVSEAP